MSAAHPFEALSAPLDGLNLIEASAGTGKTWTIAALYARLVLERELRPEQILVVTYTKAATAELRGRIRARLAELADALEGADEPAALAHVQERDPHFLYPLLLSRPDPAADARRLRAAVSGFDAAAVFTIHGFCRRALGEHALAAGLELGREFLADEAEVLQAVADQAWKAETATATPSWLNWLIEQRQSPDSWALTLRGYLNQPGLQLALPEIGALDEREARFENAFAAASQAWASQGEAALAWLWARTEAGEFKGSHRKDWLHGSVAAWQQWLGGLPLPKVKEDDKAAGQAEAKLRRLYGRELAAALKTPAEVPAVFQLLEPLAEAALALQQSYTAQLACLHARLIGELGERLVERKAQLGVMSFHDLLIELDAALAGEGGPQLCQALQNRYHAALIDEFQDTDPLQFRIFDRLFGAGSDGTTAFLVGDPKQAIYAFRGAELHAYLAARDGVPHDRRYSLDTNRRSTPALVQAIEQLFNCAPQPFLLDELDYPSVQALPDKPLLYIDGQPQAALNWLWLGDAALGKGEAGERAAEQSARQIAGLLSLGRDGRARLGEQPLAGGDIAVLASSHAELQAMQAALTRHGVASVRISRQSVFDTEEARDLLQILNALAEPGERSVRTALATPLAGLSGDELYRLLLDEPAWEAMLAEFRRWHALLLGRGAMAALSAWLHDSGTALRLAGWQDGERRLTNLLHLFELLELARQDHPGLGPLLGWYRQELANAAQGEDDSRLMRLESDAARVKLVTIHAAKGLEYPLVFCPFLWNGQLFKKSETLPLCHEQGVTVLDFGSPRQAIRWELAGQERLAEKLRLLYVALTRPRTACFIAWGEVNEMAQSALGWLLAGGVQRQRSAAELQAELTTLIDAGETAMGWAAPLPERAARERAQEPVTVELAHLGRRLHWQWRMSSFSALTAGVHAEAPDYDALTAPAATDMPPAGRFDSFPAGPRAGVLLHSLFEEWDFNRRDRAALEALAGRLLAAHGFETHWAPMAADMVEAALYTPLTDGGARLADVPTGQRLIELEFTFALLPFSWPALAALLAQPAYGLPAVFAEAAASLHADVAKGYLKGFIDLSCQLDGRHYILDWKSNRLTDYGEAGLLAAMADEHYYLQALIYCVALHRYLKWRKPDYQYAQHFGGALYLFLRGLPEAGLWRYQPPLALLEALEVLLCGSVS
ncbi:exodeoxyribonuclease V subunit beta [Chitinimonas arctica]|uniref:RecBCD enzyme subunit RecB n=1 Tax=Chitinimonas arctica TaxID=2594795 RepID=A0A516SER6_9NEIS|nr:exodeoxyribonuclease V subunit beta [Chitinimonas arctica]QDQ26633.1 exodeoxyribonuclease V subunit beta [Chitinimonas arctica]